MFKFSLIAFKKSAMIPTSGTLFEEFCTGLPDWDIFLHPFTMKFCVGLKTQKSTQFGVLLKVPFLSKDERCPFSLQVNEYRC